MTKLPKAVAEYYSNQDSLHKETLLEMRRRILEVIPESEEIIKYGMPTFLFNGKAVVGIMANKNHIGYYPYSGSVLIQFPEISEKYKTTKGALHIPLGKPLSTTIIRKLVRASIRNNN